MIATLLFTAFLALMFLGVPIGAALGLAGAAAIALANAETQWFGLLAVPVFDIHQRVPYAISISLSTSRLKQIGEKNL